MYKRFLHGQLPSFHDISHDHRTAPGNPSEAVDVDVGVLDVLLYEGDALVEESS